MSRAFGPGCLVGGRLVLSVEIITPGRSQYYTQTVASGIEDYMSGRGESPGQWMGRSREHMGVDGEVSVEQMALLFEDEDPRHPVTGEVLGRPYKVPDDKHKANGWDLTPSDPKSFSALWAVAPPEMRAELDACHLGAVQAVVDYLETHAAFARQGRGGVAQVDTAGLTIARFDHRTSRAKDPQRHSHLLVSSRVLCTDGQWRALDSRALHRELKPAGMVFQAALRAETAARLGVRWGPVNEHGQADIEGVPEGLVEFWSQRRAQIEAAAAPKIAEREQDLGRSLTDMEIRQLYETITLATRDRKDLTAESDGGLHAMWRRQAIEHSWDPDQWIPRVIGHQPPSMTSLNPDDVITLALGELQLKKSTWRRAQVAGQIARFLPAGAAPTAGAVVSIVEQLADQAMAHAEVVRIGGESLAPVDGLRRRDDKSVFEPHGAATYTTRTTLAVESSVLDFAEHGRHTNVAVVEPATVDATVAAHGLDADQAAAVRHLVTGGHQLACVIGPAGTGKTRTIGAAAELWQNRNIPVRGFAVSAVAAEVLEAAAGIRSETLAKFLYELRLGNPAYRLASGEVAVVDEASMAATTDFAALCMHAKAVGAKIVLVGDPRQLGAVDAGGMFRLLGHDYGVQLTGVHRFTNEWERAASLRLRDADTEVLHVYDAHGRLHGGSREDHLDTAYRWWLEARARGQSLVITGPDHHTVERLALRIRAARVALSEVEPDGYRRGRQIIGMGDDIVTLRNDRRLVTSNQRWVRNGDRWRITGRHRDASLQVVSLTGRGHIRLPADYVAEHVALAYAVTIHKAEGVNVDHGLTLVDERATDIALHVALTRGRYSNHALVVTADHGADRHGPQPSRPSPVAVLAGILARDASERSATETIRRALADSEEPVWLYRCRDHIDRLVYRRAGPDPDDQHHWLENHPEVAALRLEITERLQRGAAQPASAQAALERIARRPSSPGPERGLGLGR